MVRERRYYVYILISEITNKKYTGLAEDVDKRLKEHNSGKTKSTKAFVPWKLAYTEKLADRESAREREKYFKTAAGRRFINKKLGTTAT